MNLYAISGKDFEVETKYFFPSDLYKELHRTPPYNRKCFDKACLHPDFQFEIMNTNIQFWVECKHRVNGQDAAFIKVFRADQLSRYKSYQNSFLLLCSYLHDEQNFYFVPFTKIEWNNLDFKFLEDYKLTLDPPVWPKHVKKYLH